jgi:putative transposase
VFLSPESVAPHVARLAKAAAEFRCVVPIYCFMPDHLHVMLKGLGEGADALAAMSKFKLLSGLWFDRKHMAGWQVNFHDHVVRGYEDWREHAKYISRNPVRAGLVGDPFDYPFTGAIGCDLSDVICGSS